jgi:hypothetical protein
MYTSIKGGRGSHWSKGRKREVSDQREIQRNVGNIILFSPFKGTVV